MARLDFPVLFVLFLLQVPGCRGTETVLASKEEDVSLMCLDLNVTDLNSHRARWLKYGTDARSTEVISEWPKKSKNDKRGTLRVEEKGQFSLFFKSLKESDAGFYSCEIWEGWDIVQVKNISLKVKDCRTLPVVQAAPQTPVELNCQINTASELQRSAEISWEMLKGSKRIPVDSPRVEKNGTFLAFQSVTASDDGWYRCTLGQTQQCSEILLRVTDNIYAATTVPVTAAPTTQQEVTVTERVQTNWEEPSREPLTPVVASVIVGILILVASAGFFLYRRCKTRRETQQQLRQPAGCVIDSLDAYENLTLPHLPNSGNRVNSLYLFQEENVRTFRY